MEILKTIISGEGVQQRGPSYTDAGNGNWEQPLGGHRAGSLASHENENEIRLLPNTKHKNRQQVDERSKHKDRYNGTLE